MVYKLLTLILFLFLGSIHTPSHAIEKHLPNWEKILAHPTSHILKKSKNSKDYLSFQLQFLNEMTQAKDIMELKAFGKNLAPKELASLFHQRDLLNAILSNPNHKKELERLGFDTEAYVRGSLDSDMGKLKAYQELFTHPSEKSDFLFYFLQRKTADKSWGALSQIFKKYQMPDKPFINPKLSPPQLRVYFKKFPILLGYLHEFPGMVDAVIAFERGILTPLEFENQILVNLGHSGPSAGYWNYLETVLIPNSFKDQKESLADLFSGTQYQIEKSKHQHPHYFKTTSFESFVSTFYDRMSQGTRGGYFKIDLEINGDPLKTVQTLLLKDNPEGTIKQLKELEGQIDSCANIPKEKKLFFHKLVKAGISYLHTYQRKVNEHISYSEDTIHFRWRDKDLRFTKKGDQYFLQNKFPGRMPASKGASRALSREEMRKILHAHLFPLLANIEQEIGDPFRNDKWK